MSFSILINPKSDPTSASTLQLDELEDLEDEIIQTEADHQVINELRIRPKTKYKVKYLKSLHKVNQLTFIENEKFHRGSKHDCISNTG